MIVQVTVKPGAKHPLIRESSTGLIVYVHERAHDGEANIALVKALSNYYNVPKTCIQIKKGVSSRKKVVEISERM